MRWSIVLLVFGLVSGGLAVTPHAAAKGAKATCTWHASFWGYREVGVINTVRLPYGASRCFSSQASCKSWLYDVQTAYPLDNNAVFCHRT